MLVTARNNGYAIQGNINISTHPSPSYLANAVVADERDGLVEHDVAGEGDLGDPQPQRGGGEAQQEEEGEEEGGPPAHLATASPQLARHILLSPETAKRKRGE